MEMTYYTGDGMHPRKFNDFIMSVPGTKKIYGSMGSNSDITYTYCLKSVNLEYWCSGSPNDGLPIKIQVESDDEFMFKKVCRLIEDILKN